MLSFSLVFDAAKISKGKAVKVEKFDLVQAYALRIGRKEFRPVSATRIHETVSDRYHVVPAYSTPQEFLDRIKSL
jgi:hypothetical protein